MRRRPVRDPAFPGHHVREGLVRLIECDRHRQQLARRPRMLSVTIPAVTPTFSSTSRPVASP